MKKDLILKAAIEIIAKDLAKYLLNLEIKEVKFIDKELKRIEKREADLLLIADNKQILHFEIQNSNDKNMIFRMLRYYVDIKTIYKALPINQYLIYIGKEKALAK